MKTTRSYLLMLLTLVVLIFVPNSFAQDASPEYVVRVVYFLPNDRKPNPEIDTQLDTLMKEAQSFYADVMESYGFDRKIFGLETDGDGKVVVHHINGQDNDTYYHDGTLSKAVSELNHKFDTSKNIYFVAIDISSEQFDVNQPSSHICGQAAGAWAATPASGICFNYRVIAHELGHAFGLFHDRFNYSGTDSMVDSFCSAEWLDVHPYFNEGSQIDFNEPTTVNMLPPSRAPSSSAIRFSFEVRDADGLHQAQLYIPALDSVVACKQLKGERTTVELDTTYVVSEINFIWLQVIDVNGNHTGHNFPVDISNFLLPPKKVTIPDANLAAAIRAYTDLPPDAEITTHTMARLTRLWRISDDPITNLTGLEYAVNLVALSLYRQNTITDFSALSGLRELRFLELAGTGISDISILSALTKLKVLHLYENTFQDISVLAGLTNLKILELWNNQISSITPLTGLTHLTYLDLHNNQISNVSPLVGLVNLEELYLAGNPIEDFSPLRTLIANNPNLKIDIDIPPLPSGITFTPNTVADQMFTVGTSINLTLPTATGGTAPYTYTLSPIPAGLQFDTATQLLSGTPTTEGTTTLTYTATDATGASAVLNFTINVSTTPLFWMYWVSDGGIRRATNDGTNLQTLVASGGCFSRYIALDVGNGKLYWTDNSANKIQRANLDGSNVEDVIIGLNHPTDLALDVTARKMYWIDWDRSTIQRANLDGSNVEVLVAHVFNPRGIALDVAGRKMYWTAGGQGIQRANLDGTIVETLVTTRLDHPTAIAVDVAGGKMYWAMNTITVNDDDGVIQRANLDGSNVEDLVSGLDTADGLALDVAGGKMYWTQIATEIGPNVIRRANLDGSNAEDVITPIRRPCDLALGISVSPPTPPLISFNPPTIADQTFTVGTSVSLTLPIATGGTPPYAYSIAPPPPAGLVFNTATRLLSGTPTTVMQQTRFTYTAADATGAAASLTFNFEVTGAGRNPLDVNENGQVNVIDLVLVAAAYGEQGAGLPADVNADGIVNIQDLIAIAAAIDASGATLPQAVEAALLIAAAEVENIEAIGEAPRRFSTSAQAFSSGVVYSNVADALTDVRALGTGDVHLGKWLPLLEELLQVLTEMNAIPETTALLPNYPNPFNPETWIPYHLATEANVTLTIYNVQGDVVRQLMLGQQSAGVYESRGRAAYWDGRNTLGEPVASGLYFYTLTAGDFAATRKLLIRK